MRPRWRRWWRRVRSWWRWCRDGRRPATPCAVPSSVRVVRYDAKYEPYPHPLGPTHGVEYVEASDADELLSEIAGGTV